MKPINQTTAPLAFWSNIIHIIGTSKQIMIFFKKKILFLLIYFIPKLEVGKLTTMDSLSEEVLILHVGSHLSIKTEIYLFLKKDRLAF